jgi:hypothetical protein
MVFRVLIQRSRGGVRKCLVLWYVCMCAQGIRTVRERDREILVMMLPAACGDCCIWQCVLYKTTTGFVMV